MALQTVYVPRAFGGVLIIQVDIEIPVATVVANATAFVRSGTALARVHGGGGSQQAFSGGAMLTTIIQDYSPVYRGDTRRPFAPQFRYKSGNPVDLTGVTITMKMVKTDGVDSGKVKNCTGTWTIQGAATNGLASYQRVAGDVSEVGTWAQQIALTDSNGTEHADPLPLTILDIAL